VTKATVTCALWNLYNDKKPKQTVSFINRLY